MEIGKRNKTGNKKVNKNGNKNGNKMEMEIEMQVVALFEEKTAVFVVK